MFSITGEHDHTPFGGQGVQLVWGKRPDEELVHISDAERGKNCGCVCPACELPLLAKKGPKLAEHFSHQGGRACAGVRETNAHAWAKKVLSVRKEIYLPPVIGMAAGKRLETHAGRLYRFEDARLEKRTGSIIPDVVLVDARGRELIVEILVTHACDEMKIAKIRDQGTPALEVDMGDLKEAETEEVIVDALIGANPVGRAPREWLHNPKIERAGELLKAKLAHLAAQRAASLDQRARSITRAAASIKTVSIPTALRDVRTVNAYDRSDLIGIPIDGERGFRVRTMHWQAAVLARVIFAATDQWSTIEARWAKEEVEDCIAPAFRSQPAAELRAAICLAEPGFLFPIAAIARYLGCLVDRRVLERHSRDTFRLTDEARGYFRKRGSYFAARRDRNAARHRLRAIVERIPVEDRGAFSLNHWLARPIDGFGARFADLVESGDRRWSAFEASLREIERMFLGGTPPGEALGLPLEAEMARARERARARQEESDRLKCEAAERAASERVDSLSRRANKAFGPALGAEWLTTVAAAGELSFLELARKSYDGFHQAHLALGVAERELIERQRRESEAEACRTELRRKAIQVFGSERAEVFLHSTHPRIGTSPWMRCAEPQGLRDCLALMQERTPAERRDY